MSKNQQAIDVRAEGHRLRAAHLLALGDFYRAQGGLHSACETYAHSYDADALATVRECLDAVVRTRRIETEVMIELEAFQFALAIATIQVDHEGEG